MNYSKKLIKDYQDYMLKNGEKVSDEEAVIHLESFSVVFQSFALDKYHTKKDKEKNKKDESKK